MTNDGVRRLNTSVPNIKCECSFKNKRVNPTQWGNNYNPPIWFGRPWGLRINRNHDVIVHNALGCSRSWCLMLCCFHYHPQLPYSKATAIITLNNMELVTLNYIFFGILLLFPMHLKSTSLWSFAITPANAMRVSFH
jgi:hypothetical protein